MTPTIIDLSDPQGSWTTLISSKDLQALPMAQRRHCARFSTAIGEADRDAVASAFALALDELRGLLEAGLIKDLKIAETRGTSTQVRGDDVAVGSPVALGDAPVNASTNAGTDGPQGPAVHARPEPTISTPPPPTPSRSRSMRSRASSR